MFFSAAIFFAALLSIFAGACAQISTSAPRSPTATLPSKVAATPAFDFILSAEFTELAQHHDQQDEESSQLVILPAHILAPANTKKSERPRQSARPATETATSTQKAPEPRADDRLLELVEKDLNKAVGQNVEPRRIQFSKAVTDDPKVRHFIDHYSKTTRRHFAQMLSRSGRYMPMIAKTLRDAGLPEELGYLALIESGFATDSTSAAGAAGLWQFVPRTARRYGLRIDSWVDERRDPVKSTRAAAAYLKDLHSYYGRWFLTTAAYNAGQGIIDQAMLKSKDKDYGSLRENSQLSAETRSFVPKFVAVAQIASEPRKYGFENLRYDAPLVYQEIESRESVKLETIAAMTGTDVRQLVELNPALLRGQTPPGERNYRVRIPEGHGLLIAKATPQKPGDPVEPEKESSPQELITHEVKQGETLFSIASRYGQNVRALMRLNGLTTSKLRIGQQLKIWVDALRGTMR